MLKNVDTLYPNILKKVPRTDSAVVVRNLLMYLQKKSWFEKLYQDVTINQRKTYTIKCKYPIDVTKELTLYEGYQLKYMWEDQCTKNNDIYSAVEKFREKFKKEEWFYDVDVSENEKTIEVTLKNWLNLNHRLDYFENFPVRYGLCSKKEEEDSKNVIP